MRSAGCRPRSCAANGVRRIIDHDGDGAGHRRHRALAEAGRGRRARSRLRRVDRRACCRRRASPSMPTSHFVRDKPMLEAVASSLTEMFSPGIIAERVAGMLAQLRLRSAPETLAYFTPRLTQAPRDVDFALDYVKREARRRGRRPGAGAGGAALQVRRAVGPARRALHYAYVEPGLIPPGAFVPR